MVQQVRHASEDEARELAESSRESEWSGRASSASCWGLGTPFRYGRFGSLAPHLRFAERASRRLARSVFHGMVWYRQKLERKQAFLFRTVDIAMELAVLVATVVRAQAMVDRRDPAADKGVELADALALDARRFVERRFRELWANDDDARATTGRQMLDGAYLFLEDPATVADARAPAPAADGVSTAAK